VFVYGPVPSRRLGRSLGVSPIPPKTCSYSCVYCQLGRTKYLQVERKSFYPEDDIFSEIQNNAKKSRPDFITFVGDGEPTLCADLGFLIQKTKSELQIPTAVITNGSLFFKEDVKKDLLAADIVLPTLDAGCAKTFRHINRPHREINFDAMIEGQIDFHRQFAGQIWLEIMLVKGLNDSDEELKQIKERVDLIKPDKIYITTPIRPPAESWVTPPAPETILKAQQIFAEAVSITDLESGDFGLQQYADARQAIMEISSRHPLRLEQALKIADTFSKPGSVKEMIETGELIEIYFNNRQYVLPAYFVRGKAAN
jgi:wyosine [tRNA(Phe)-imidazoG37] synthetase (radical SAM superfamily)